MDLFHSTVGDSNNSDIKAYNSSINSVWDTTVIANNSICRFASLQRNKNLNITGSCLFADECKNNDLTLNNVKFHTVSDVLDNNISMTDMEVFNEYVGNE
jgi:hypothetical protein